LKLKTIVFGVIVTMSMSVNAAPLYISSFADNGNKVTEVRTFANNSAKTFEWLDLTVTNSISYDSLIADLADDNKLNNSIVLRVASSGALADITTLSLADQIGWETQSSQNIVTLLNSFFGLSMVGDAFHNFNANVASVESFINMFGDTYHERLDDQEQIYINLQPAAFIGSTQGLTSDVNGIFNKLVTIADGQYYYLTEDSEQDYIRTSNLVSSRLRISSGTWFAREVVQANAPATIALFALASVGLGLRRRLM
jgi:hypothetical protein